jgi:hypothetical protein
MKRRMSLAFVALSLITSMVVMRPSGAMPAPARPSAQNPSIDIEEFRHELFNYLTALEVSMQVFSDVPAVRQQFDQAGLDPLALLADAKQQLSVSTPEELSALRTAYARFPNWRDTPRGISSLIHPGLRQLTSSGVADLRTLQSVTVDDCAAALAANHTNTDISIAAAVLIAAEAVMEGFPTDGLTILARLIPIAAVTAAKSALLAIETLKNIKDDCNSDTFEAAIQEQVTNSTNTIVNNDNTNQATIVNNDNTNRDTVLSSLTAATNTVINNDNSNTTALTATIGNAQTSINNNSNANTATIVTNDNSNKTTILANDNANTVALATAITNAQTTVVNNSNANRDLLRDLLLRTQIEADLAEADSASPVALYLTPTSQGGHLDLVQAIVTETLANIEAAGSSIGTARTELAQADAQKAAGQFKDAYKSYRKAYKSATK